MLKPTTGESGLPIEPLEVPKTTPSRPSSAPEPQIFDIRDFGARCDGNTDDYAAIARVLARAGESLHSIVTFPASKTACMVSHALKVPDYVTLQAAAGTVTVTATADNVSNPVLLTVGSNVRICGLSFDGGGKSHPNVGNVIQGYKVSNVVFDHVALRHTRGIGMLMSSNVVNVVIRNSIFDDIGNHWKISYSASDRKEGVVFCCGTGNHDNVAANNRFSDIGLDALQFSDQRQVTIIGNRFSLANGQQAVVMARDFPAAIFFLRIDHGMINDNTVTEAQGNCVDAPGVTNVSLSHNTLAGCGEAGIGLFDSSFYAGSLVTTNNVSVSNNTIIDNGRWVSNPFPGGITLGGSATNVSIFGNTVGNTQVAMTQLYAVYGVAGSHLTGLMIARSNHLTGNVKSSFGGIVSGSENKER